jgi:hypothetical protein
MTLGPGSGFPGGASGRSGGTALLPVVFGQKSAVCSPRACIVINGTTYPVRRYRIEKNGHGATNTADFELAYAGNPDWTQELYRGADAGNANQPVYAKIYAGFPPNPGPVASTAGLSQRFYGVVDQYEPEDMKQTTFRLRSIAAPLTTDHITTNVQNLTTVDFIKQQCAQYNITPNIDPSIKNPFTLAKVYAQEFVVGLKNLIKWDVMLRSSIFDDTEIWEDNGVLNYFHPWNVKRETINLQYGTNVKAFKGIHAPQFSRLIRVAVHSYRDKTRTAVTTRLLSLLDAVAVQQVVKTLTATPNWGTNSGTTITYHNNGQVTTTKWTSSGGATGSSNAPISESGVELYDFYLPNLTYQECNELCQAIWRQLSMYEYQGTFTLQVTPDLLELLEITALLNMNGYGMPRFNTQYWPRTMDETFEGAGDTEGGGDVEGWFVEFHGVNHFLPAGAV